MRCVSFLDESTERLGISRHSREGEISPYIVKKLLKDDLAEIAQNALFYLSDLVASITCNKGVSHCMKSELIHTQQTVTKLQSELLEYKDNELEALKSTVKSAVENSVKSVFKSYSSVLQTGLTPSEGTTPTISKQELRNVVQNVVEEEDRSKSLMIFGLPEKSNEDLNETVNKLFTALGEKPRIDACRLGKKKSNNSSRPVKVTATSSMIVAQILSKAKQLRKKVEYERVYLSPDRSPEQRLKHKQLVIELKQLAAAKPGQKHYISGGSIHSVDKTN